MQKKVILVVLANHEVSVAVVSAVTVYVVDFGRVRQIASERLFGDHHMLSDVTVTACLRMTDTPHGPVGADLHAASHLSRDSHTIP